MMKAGTQMTDKDIHEAILERTEGEFFHNKLIIRMTGAFVTGGMNREGGGYRANIMKAVDTQLYITGGFMETIDEALKLIGEQVNESKSILQNLFNEVRAVHDQVEPELRKQITEIRNARMGIVSETQTMLTMLRDVRKFFLESDYEKEMGRLKQFIAVCKELEAMKKSGVLDAVSDTIIKLSIKERE